MTTAAELTETLLSMRNEEQRLILSRFFKTGKGQYGEGDMFLGLKVPQIRAIVRQAKHDVPLDEIVKLLHSTWHEVRLCGLLLLVEEMKAATPRRRDSPTLHADRRTAIVNLFLCNASHANNWDLVDLSCQYILGTWLTLPLADGTMPSADILDRLAASINLWEQRISIVSTLALIRTGRFGDTLRISDRLLSHPHDLIHKAVGWMLREIGKRDIDTLRAYLHANCSRMHRTTLRYAIEKMSATERTSWMHR